MRILVLALGVPFPPLGGGLTRTFHLLRSLSSRHDVTLAAFSYGEPRSAAPYPVEVMEVPWRWAPDYAAMIGADADAAHRAYQRLALTGDQPWFASVFDAEPMRQAVIDSLRSSPDLVLLEGTPLATFLPILPQHIPRVVDFFDIHTVIAQQDVNNAIGTDPAALQREAERTLAFERNAVAQCDACLTVSTQDADVARDQLGASVVHVVPNGVDTSYFAPATDPTSPGTLLFTGRMNYPPNVDAVQFFVRDILPLVRREIAHTTLHIVGAAPAQEVNQLQAHDVIVHGRVDDLRPSHAQAEVEVVPIRAGGGTRLKVLEAAACGKAIVSTTLGAQGLPFRDGEHILLADSPVDFAAAVVRLLRDPELRRRLGDRARAAACEFDWNAIGQTFRLIVEGVVRDRA